MNLDISLLSADGADGADGATTQYRDALELESRAFILSQCEDACLSKVLAGGVCNCRQHYPRRRRQATSAAKSVNCRNLKRTRGI